MTRLIRVGLTLLLIYGVCLETGIYTTIFAALVALRLEVDNIG